MSIPPATPPPVTLHPVVREVLDAYLRAVDDAVPGLVQGLYLTGSVALDDFHVGVSDVDFVAVTAAKPDDQQVHGLRRAHALLTRQCPRPFFDGPYVTWSELALAPRHAQPGPNAFQARFCPASTSERIPVTWHTVARQGVAVRGPRPGEFEVATDRAELAGWTRHNLDEYWGPWWRRRSRLLSPSGLAALGGTAPVWGVLGVARLHYTLATGGITSKSGAGRYARTAFDPRWRRIIDECLRLRRGADDDRGYRDPLARRRDALDFVAMVIAQARRLA
ncbi:aminoglycoside adenylyltransferase domain-containing protein [Micromonospora sp. NPDC049679]|uniref:aminoglycoside adenylyltransferase domain-containing protein n=1 Tax=Micromonospora sp. NPDC049679 TaxID=3155920 RepID=UPI0033C0B581